MKQNAEKAVSATRRRTGLNISSAAARVLIAALAMFALGIPVAQAQQFVTKTLLLPNHRKVTEVTYEVIDGLAVLEGDIVLGRDKDLTDLKGVSLSVSVNEKKRLWPNGIVPYTLGEDVTKAHAATIKQAIEHIEQNTPVRFVPHSSQQNYVEFIYHDDTNSCKSPVGMKGEGKQHIFMSPEGCKRRTMIHELLHTLGIWHEQSREDREDHIAILWSNIQKGRENNFEDHVSDGMDIGSYDYESIMHYRSNTFGCYQCSNKKYCDASQCPNGSCSECSKLTTIIPCEKSGELCIPRPGIKIGQGAGLSSGDIDALNLLYPPVPGRMTGVFSGKKTRLWVGASWKNFTKKWKAWAKKGLRLVDVDVHRDGRNLRFNGVWEKGSGRYALYRYSSWKSFTNKWADLQKSGQRLIDVETYSSYGKRWFVGVWRQGSGKYALYRYNSWSDFTNKWKQLAERKQRLIDVELYRSGGRTWYVGVWRGGSHGYALYQYSDWKRFKSKMGQLERSGLYLDDFERCDFGGSSLYVGVFRKESRPKRAFWHNANWSSFARKRSELASKGIYLSDFESL